VGGRPYNNYVLQATARTARLLRSGTGRIGLVTCVSGVLTKHGAAVWSTEVPSLPYRSVDVTTDHPSREMAPQDHEGPGRILGCTVLAGERPHGVAVVDLADGRRAVATTTDPAVVTALEAGAVGREVVVAAERLGLGAR
jgi:acetyl-CoA C-acetyltransferase